MHLIFFLIISFLITNISFAEFVDKVNQSGINFKHINGMQGDYYFPEIMGSGVAVFDFDNDGDLDLYFVQSGHLNNPNDAITDQLYRNDTTKSDNPKFTNVSKKSGISSIGYGMGASTGDINNDGFVDLLINNYGQNAIYINKGNGTFSLLDNSLINQYKSWSVSSSLADYNNDGLLDVYIVNYVDYFANDKVKTCLSVDESKDYCSPQAFSYQHDRLFKNLGANKFEEITSIAGLKSKAGPGLGVVTTDVNKDGLLDYYIANDGEPNHLWLNQGNDSFKENGFMSGLSVNMNGKPEASMGVDVSDYDNDGDEDFFMTHLNRQTNTLYVNNGKGRFTDLSIKMKIGSSSYSYTGFGTMWLDYDLDGYLDLFSANGEVIKNQKQQIAGDAFPFKQPNQLWKNLGNGSFSESSKQQDSSFLQPKVSRGAARVDIDNDGDLDIIVSNNNGTPHLYINKLSQPNNWIGIDLYNKKTKRTETDALIELTQEDVKMFRRVKTDGGYASSNDHRVVFGLNSNKSKANVKVNWRDGSSSIHKNLDLNKYHVIKK